MQPRLPSSRLPFALSAPEAHVLRAAAAQHESARLVTASLDPRSKSADVRMLLRAYYETGNEGEIGTVPLVRGSLKGKLDAAFKEALSRDPSYAKSLAERAAEIKKRNPPVFEKKQGRTVRKGANPLLDEARSLLGERLPPEYKRAILHYIEHPSHGEWTRIRGIIIVPGSMRGSTIWQWVRHVDTSFPAQDDGETHPSGFTVARAIKAASESQKGRQHNRNIRVTRDAYCIAPHQRAPYTRTDGTHVPGGQVAGHCVPQTTFLAKDQGKPGRSAYGAKAGPHAASKGFRPWITTEGTLGEGFLTTMTSSERRRQLDAAVKQFGYRTVLGKVTALQRSYTLRHKYGAALDEAHSYLVKKYGGSGSFGPRSNQQSNFGATLEERQRQHKQMNRLKR